ncbi:hypothetical protein ACFL3S_08890 [Gemmatimonadota bacterium]
MGRPTLRLLAIASALVAYVGLTACSGKTDANADGASDPGGVREAPGEHAGAEGYGEHREGGEAGEHREGREGGEHSEGGEHEGEVGHDEEGEESGVYIGASETWDVVRRGARLVLSFDSATDAFVGSVQNTTPLRICAVRVEVHLSTGVELGPTERVDLDPGQATEVRLPTGGEAIDSWTAHPELSLCGGL